MQMVLKLGIALVFTVGLVACSEEAPKEETPVPQPVPQPAPQPAPVPEPVPEPTPEPEPIVDGYDAVGKVSYYADSLHGRLTASEEPYDTTKFTAAHRKLPFGSVLNITNPTSQQSITVCVNDRGPFARDRILDLSRAAAAQVGLIRAGVASMQVTLVREANDDNSCTDLFVTDVGHLPPAE